MQETHKHVVIIGAGIAGLSAASYLARNGYSVDVYEAHTVPGGLCTAWKRKGYTLDYCIHWLMGTKKEGGFDRIWDELGALVNEDGSPTGIVNFDEFMRVQLSDGETFKLYGKIDRLRDEMLRLAPEDAKMIARLCRDMRTLSRLPFPGVIKEEWSLWRYLGFALANLGKIRIMLGYMNKRIGDFTAKWKSPRMREFFTAIVPQDWSTLAFIFGLALQENQSAGYPLGGSLRFARNIERRALALGARIQYGKRVNSILVEQRSAVGIRLESGEIVRADHVVSAADGHATLFEMLDGKYLTPVQKKAYAGWPLFPSSVFIGLGIGRDLTHLPRNCTLRLAQPFALPDGTEVTHIGVTVYHYDPDMAPAGKTAVTVIINTWKGEFWKDFVRDNPAEYAAWKTAIGQEVVKTLDTTFGNIQDAVEVIDVSSPHTVMRYTGNWQGSYEGFAPTPQAMKTRLPMQIKGLDHLYLIGQWSSAGGGLPPAGKGGRDVAIAICRRDKKRFSGKMG